MDFVVKQIGAEATYELRHQILRPHQSTSDCQFPNDFCESSFHIGAFKINTLISVASFFKESFPNNHGTEVFRL